ncbi:MAG: IS256 family transposase [Caldisericia bacterium]|nr:IS256 family transposase [Caldisericia bacterium]
MTNKMNLPFNVEKELSQATTMDDLMGHDGVIKKLLKFMTEKILDEEMKAHLGYQKHSQENKNTNNRRNGTTKKTVRTQFGDMELETPRDRDASFNPILVEKRSKDISHIDKQIISMYAKGMTIRDIQSHLYDIYGTEVSPSYISLATEKIMQVAKEWQNRVLDDVYPIVFLDAIHYKVRQDGKVITKASYTCLGIKTDGTKEILGIWIGESEGASYWLRVLNELKNRGVKDILIACVDGLKGFPEAIATVFPETQINTHIGTSGVNTSMHGDDDCGENDCDETDQDCIDHPEDETCCARKVGNESNHKSDIWSGCWEAEQDYKFYRCRYRVAKANGGSAEDIAKAADQARYAACAGLSAGCHWTSSYSGPRSMIDKEMDDWGNKRVGVTTPIKGTVIGPDKNGKRLKYC